MTAPMVDYKIHWLKMMSVPESRAVVGRHDGINGRDNDEDRCRAYVRHLPRNLACLTNVAIAIVRCSGRFRYLPEANRHYAARAQDALDAILIAPTA